MNDGPSFEFSQADLNNSLISAASTNNEIAVRLLLKVGAEINAKCSHGKTPLHGAAGHGSIDMCALLVEHGADINAKTITHATPLTYAALEHHKSLAFWLISEGADTQETNMGSELKVKGFGVFNMSQKEAAIRLGRLDKLKALLKENPAETGQGGELQARDFGELMRVAKACRNKEVLAFLQSLAAAQAIDGVHAMKRSKAGPP